MVDQATLVNVQGFYKHTNDKNIIGRIPSSPRDHIGPYMQQAINFLRSQKLELRSSMYTMQGGRSGDLYVVHRRLMTFNDEGSFLTASVAGNNHGQIYEVIMNNTQGWAQYLSVVLKGDFKQEGIKKLESLDFAPRHSYLAQNDHVVHPEHKKGLWLDDIVEFSHLMPGMK